MIIFTDGSTINNGKKNAIGGIGIYIPKQGEIDEWSLSYSLISSNNVGSQQSIKVTNQISELIAIILCIEKAIKLTKDTIYIYTDSKYSIECATSWSNKWVKNNWKKPNGKVIENLWLIYRLVQLTRKHPIIFKHVRAHTEEPINHNNDEYLIWFGNDKADKLAQTASRNVVDLNPSTKILKWHTLASLLVCGMKNDIKCELPFIEELKSFYENMFSINT
jgi:ribonuclease HI